MLGERLLANNLVVVGGSLTAGLLGFAFQSLVSHRLHPSDYGAAFAAMTLLTFIGLPASALTLLMARETSRSLAVADGAASATLLRSGNRVLLVTGVALGCLFILGSRLISAFFDIPSTLVMSVAFSMPVALALPLLMGELQGQQRFVSFTFVNIGQALLRLVAAVSLGLALGPVGVVLGVAMAASVSYGAVFFLVRRRLASRAVNVWLRPALRYLALVLPSTLAISVLLSADVLLVKHFFSGRIAGEYSAVAALGRAIFWAAAGVSAVLFPKVAFRESQGDSGSSVVKFSLVLVILGGVSGLIALDLGSRFLLSSFAGPEYAQAAAYLPAYALAMTLLGCSTVLVATHQSRARIGYLAVVLPLTIAEPGLILLLHQSVAQVVLALNLSMAALFVGLGVFTAFDLRRGQVLARRKTEFGAIAAEETDGHLTLSASLGAK